MKTTNEQKTDVRFYRNLAIVAVAAGIIAIVGAQLCGCDSEPAPEPDPGIDATVTQPSNDSGTTNTMDTGTTNTADAKTNTPDAQQNTDPCAAYADVPRNDWTCDVGGVPFVSTLSPRVQGNTCVIDATQFTCEETPSAPTMSGGEFHCKISGTPTIVNCYWTGQ